MQTAYDWVTMLLFCGLVTLFLERSVRPAGAGDPVLAYLPPALGCALADQFGNRGHDAIALLLLVPTVLYALVALKPWARR